MELESIDFLGHAARRAVIINGALQQLLFCAFKAIEPRRIRTEREIEADGADGGTVAETEAYRLNHVVEVLKIVMVLPEADTNIVDGTIHIAGVVKQNAAQVIAK